MRSTCPEDLAYALRDLLTEPSFRVGIRWQEFDAHESRATGWLLP